MLYMMMYTTASWKKVQTSGWVKLENAHIYKILIVINWQKACWNIVQIVQLHQLAFWWFSEIYFLMLQSHCSVYHLMTRCNLLSWNCRKIDMPLLMSATHYQYVLLLGFSYLRHYPSPEAGLDKPELHLVGAGLNKLELHLITMIYSLTLFF